MYHFRFSGGYKALPTAVPHRGTLVGSIAVATYLVLFALVVLVRRASLSSSMGRSTAIRSGRVPKQAVNEMVWKPLAHTAACLAGALPVGRSHRLSSGSFGTGWPGFGPTPSLQSVRPPSSCFPVWFPAIRAPHVWPPRLFRGSAFLVLALFSRRASMCAALTRRQPCGVQRLLACFAARALFHMPPLQRCSLSR